MRRVSCERVLCNHAHRQWDVYQVYRSRYEHIIQPAVDGLRVDGEQAFRCIRADLVTKTGSITRDLLGRLPVPFRRRRRRPDGSQPKRLLRIGGKACTSDGHNSDRSEGNATAV